MWRFIIILILGILGWQAYGKYQAYSPSDAARRDVVKPNASASLPAVLQDSNASSRYSCDGRIHCSQMTSCAEATFFLKNCPGVKMDGDNDGIACEQQWCN
jgi:hypothetical protein